MYTREELVAAILKENPPIDPTTVRYRWASPPPMPVTTREAEDIAEGAMRIFDMFPPVPGSFRGRIGHDGKYSYARLTWEVASGPFVRDTIECNGFSADSVFYGRLGEIETLLRDGVSKWTSRKMEEAAQRRQAADEREAAATRLQ